MGRPHGFRATFRCYGIMILPLSRHILLIFRARVITKARPRLYAKPIFSMSISFIDIDFTIRFIFSPRFLHIDISGAIDLYIFASSFIINFSLPTAKFTACDALLVQCRLHIRRVYFEHYYFGCRFAITSQAEWPLIAVRNEYHYQPQKALATLAHISRWSGCLAFRKRY